MSENHSFLSQSNKQAFKNPWVLGLLAGIILVVGVNAAFIITAFKTSPGLVDKDYYEKGQDHEQNIRKKLAARSQLGWTVNLNLPEIITINQPSMFNLNVVDRNGVPLKDAVVKMQAYRPSDSDADFTAEMTTFAPGVFQSKIVLPLKGTWDLIVVIQAGEDTFDIRQRIRVSAN
jgi:nitrogen fixation protein FixH